MQQSWKVCVDDIVETLPVFSRSNAGATYVIICKYK
jgi:hypothetical protein